MQEYIGLPLKELAESYRAAKFTNQGWILEPKQGRLVLQLPEVQSEISLTFKRVSGDGKVKINGKSFLIASKIADHLIVDPCSSIIITRDDSSGEVVLMGVTLNLSEDMAKNWKTILSKCTGHHSIRLLGAKLMAGEGGWLQPEEIFTTVETDPPNAFSKVEGKIRFNYPCEILKLVLDPNAPTPPALVLPSRKPPSPNIQPAKLPADPLPPPSFSEPATSAPVSLGVTALLDTSSSSQSFRKIITTSNKLVKVINSNHQDYLLIKKGGSVSIPLAQLIANRTYVYSILTKKLNGNGKLSVILSNGRQTYGSPVQIVDNHYTNKSSAIQVGDVDSDNFKLILTMGDDSSGEVLISRISLMDSAIPIFSLTRMPVLSSVAHTLVPQESSPYSSTISIKEMTLNAAVVTVPDQIGGMELDCTIYPLTYQARCWLSKTAPYVKGMKVYDPTRQVLNLERNDNIDLTIGSLGNLKRARGKRIFLEEWNLKYAPNQQDLDILNRFDIICSNSRNILFILKSLLPGKELVLTTKPWWRTIDSTDKQNRVVYLEKDEIITRILVDNWRPEFPPLTVVGTNLDLPEKVIKVSEFLEYPELVRLIANSSVLLDISFCNNYHSGVLELANSLGCQIVTNNLFEINPQYHFLNCELSPFKMDLDKLSEAMRQINNRGVTEYSGYFMKHLKNLVGR